VDGKLNLHDAETRKVRRRTGLGLRMKSPTDTPLIAFQQEELFENHPRIVLSLTASDISPTRLPWLMVFSMNQPPRILVDPMFSLDAPRIDSFRTNHWLSVHRPPKSNTDFPRNPWSPGNGHVNLEVAYIRRWSMEENFREFPRESKFRRLMSPGPLSFPKRRMLPYLSSQAPSPDILFDSFLSRSLRKRGK
jgi:hypothetical protein